MKKPRFRSFRPSIEPLEDRQLLSITPLQTTPAPVQDGPAAPTHAAMLTDLPAHLLAPHALHGHGSGSYDSPLIVPDLGRVYTLRGTVALAGLGHFAVSGSLHSTGFMSQGRADGELTFSNGRGSLTLKLVGPVQPGFSPLPGAFHYRVVAATGAYHGLHASGVLHLAVHPAPCESFATHGTFTLSF
jgi:hypothetical protein